MSRPVILRPSAEADIRDAYVWYENILPGLGDRFSDGVRESLDRIEARPEMHGAVWQDVRAVRLRKFRHVIYYVVFADRVEVLAVIHGSRHESEWRSRL
jgi:plasmid stabilization system protein ParE